MQLQKIIAASRLVGLWKWMKRKHYWKDHPSIHLSLEARLTAVIGSFILNSTVYGNVGCDAAAHACNGQGSVVGDHWEIDL